MQILIYLVLQWFMDIIIICAYSVSTLIQQLYLQESKPSEMVIWVHVVAFDEIIHNWKAMIRILPSILSIVMLWHDIVL